jgi:hypothetical protein
MNVIISPRNQLGFHERRGSSLAGQQRKPSRKQQREAEEKALGETLRFWNRTEATVFFITVGLLVAAQPKWDTVAGVVLMVLVGAGLYCSRMLFMSTKALADFRKEEPPGFIYATSLLSMVVRLVAVIILFS